MRIIKEDANELVFEEDTNNYPGSTKRLITYLIVFSLLVIDLNLVIFIFRPFDMYHIFTLPGYILFFIIFFAPHPIRVNINKKTNELKFEAKGVYARLNSLSKAERVLQLLPDTIKEIEYAPYTLSSFFTHNVAYGSRIVFRLKNGKSAAFYFTSIKISPSQNIVKKIGNYLHIPEKMTTGEIEKYMQAPLKTNN
jgi:hypothetical protein